MMMPSEEALAYAKIQGWSRLPSGNWLDEGSEGYVVWLGGAPSQDPTRWYFLAADRYASKQNYATETEAILAHREMYLGDLDLDGILVRRNATTEGDWRWANHGTWEVEAPPFQVVADCGTISRAEQDAKFIGQAKQDIRKLVVEIQRLRAGTDQERRMVAWLRTQAARRDDQARTQQAEDVAFGWSLAATGLENGDWRKS